MHDTACALRPVPNGALMASPALASPDHVRGDPFPGLVADWSELLPFDLTVNAGTEEGIASRLLYGPFLITEIAFRSSGAGNASQLLKLATGDTSPAGQTVVGSDNGVLAPVTTDSSRTVGTFYATNVYERHRVDLLSQTTQTRLQVILNNTTAGAITIIGHVGILHLKPAQLIVAPR